MLFAVLFQDFAVLWEYLGIGARMPQENVGSTTADNAPRAKRREWIGLAPAMPALLHGPDRFRRYMPERGRYPEGSVDTGADVSREPRRRTTPSAESAAGPPTATGGAVPGVSVLSAPSRQYFRKNTYLCQQYMPEEQAQGCVIAELENPSSKLVLLAIRPDRWLTFDFSDEAG